MSKVYDVLDITEYIINHCNNIGQPISNLQLQKILYYLQGCYLAKYKDKLFKQNIENWKYGPVVPEAYTKYKEHTRHKILREDLDFYDLDLYVGLDKEQIDFINKIIEAKSKLTAPELVAATHDEDPWKKTSEYQLIDTTLLQEYFSDKGKYHYEYF